MINKVIDLYANEADREYLLNNVAYIEDAIKSVTQDDVKAIAKEIISNASRIQFVSNGVEKK